MSILSFIHNMPAHLSVWSHSYGMGIYVILFLVIFAETGLVVTPFLPGDSLLFAAGTVAAISGGSLHIGWLAVFLTVAAVVGDSVNYQIGRALKNSRLSSRWINPKHIERTREFYARYGGKTVFLARFVPIVRTYAPFVAGIGNMTYRQFLLFNALGGIVWINAFLFLGYFFGNAPGIKDNFQYMVAGIIVISVLPVIWEFIRARRSKV